MFQKKSQQSLVEGIMLPSKLEAKTEEGFNCSTWRTKFESSMNQRQPPKKAMPTKFCVQSYSREAMGKEELG